MKRINKIAAWSAALVMAAGIMPCVYAQDPAGETAGIQNVYDQLFSESVTKQDAVVVEQKDAGTAPVVLARLDNGKIAYMIDGEPFYPRALETGWWDTRIPDPATNNQNFRTDTDWDYVFQDMREIGANTVQLMVYWSDWEPTEGNYDYTFLDGVIEKAALYGLKTELILFLHSHAIPGVIPRSQDDFWGYHLDDRDGKCYTIQWGTGKLNSTAAFRAAAAPGNGQEIFLEYWHPEVFPRLMNALTDLAAHYKSSGNVIGYQVGNEEGFNYYVNGGKDQNPYYSSLRELYLSAHPGATEKDFRIATVNRLWTSMNNAIHAGDPYKPTTSNLQSALTEKSGSAYNANDGSTMAFYENLDMIGSMFYANANTIYPNLDKQYNGGLSTNQEYATAFPILFPTEIGANTNNSRVLKIIAAETMARGGQGFGVYCYGELYSNSKNYKNSAPKPSRAHTQKLFSAVSAFEDVIWAGVPVTQENTQNICMTPLSSTNNPSLAVLEKDEDNALGLLYFTGALGGNVSEEDRTRDVSVTVKKAGDYAVDIVSTDGTVVPTQSFACVAAGGSFQVAVATTNYNVALIRVTRTQGETVPETLPAGEYKIRSAAAEAYLTTQTELVAGKQDEFAVLTAEPDEAAVWTLEPCEDGSYFVLLNGKGLNVRFRGQGSDHIVVSEKNDNPNQHWEIVRQPEGSCVLKNQNTGQCLDSLGGTGAQAKTEQRPANEDAAQKWELIPAD